MNLGHLSILIAFFASLGALIAFIRNEQTKHQTVQIGRQKIASRLYYVSVAASLIASAVLWYAFFTHQFQYSYVNGYSSKDLPLIYLISAFWAGQEGTFLLWALFVGLMGLFFLKKSNGDDNYAMAVVSAFSAFFYLLLLIKSPFELITPVPLDGRGLNPLLQDPWMAVHPPILFVGYAAATFPFALVISGLARRKYDHWINSGFSWMLFAAVSLGAGIIIGGFWAYEVLGWGGYWGWDPVENSSLVPWIIMLIAIHGFVVFKAKGSLQRTNIFLALITFILVLYATFLTRSGVLADFSVHSFVDLGINNYLIGVIVVSIALGFGLLATRFSEITSPKVDISSLNRELLLLLSMYVLGAAALFTFVGMSSPIISSLFGKASQVDISFYNKVNLPVAIAMALLLGITPFTSWIEEKKFIFFKRYSMSLILTMLSCVIAYVAGVTSFTLLLFVGASAFALISNVIITFRQYRSGWLQIGGPLSHIGVALLLIGIVGSGSFDESKQLILKQGESQSAYGYNFTFKGIPNPEALKPIMEIEVSDGKSSFSAHPKLYFSQINQAVMREPDIKVLPLKDLYISPLELQTSGGEHAHHAMYELIKGETKELEGYKITFVKFDVGQHSEIGAMRVGAVLNIEVNGKIYDAIPILSYDANNQRTPIPAELPIINGQITSGTKPHITLNALSVEEKKIIVELHGVCQHEEAPITQALVVDISIKPLMMVVWTGVVLIMVGTLIAWRRRMLQKAE